MEMNHACTNTLISFTPLQTPVYSIYTRVLMIPANCSIMSWIYFITLICHSGEEWLWRSGRVKLTLVGRMMWWRCHLISDEGFRDHLSPKNSWMIHEISINQYQFSFHACGMHLEPWLQIHNANIKKKKQNVHLFIFHFCSLGHLLLDCFFVFFFCSSFCLFLLVWFFVLFIFSCLGFVHLFVLLFYIFVCLFYLLLFVYFISCLFFLLVCLQESILAFFCGFFIAFFFCFLSCWDALSKVDIFKADTEERIRCVSLTPELDLCHRPMLTWG